MNPIKKVFKLIQNNLSGNKSIKPKNKSVFESPDLLVQHVKESLELAEKEISKLNTFSGLDVLSIQGMSGIKGRHLLNNIHAIDNANALEVGSWRGSTLVSSNYRNNINSLAIDNWSQFNGPKNEFFENYKKHMGKLPNFIDEDCFKIDLSKVNTPVNIYFYDGEHSYNSQYLAFKYYNTVFSKYFIAIVDDYNLKDVQKGTQDAFKELNYKVYFEKYLPTAYNGDYYTWWDGLYVAVVEKP